MLGRKVRITASTQSEFFDGVAKIAHPLIFIDLSNKPVCKQIRQAHQAQQGGQIALGESFQKLLQRFLGWLPCWVKFAKTCFLASVTAAAFPEMITLMDPSLRWEYSMLVFKGFLP